MGQINNITNFRTYENPVFGISMQYPAVWGAVELKSSPADTNFPGSSIALFTAPLENATDTFREKALLSIQDFTATGNTSTGNMTLDKYTNNSLNGYRNISDFVSIMESNATTLSGQPAHRIVFTEDVQNQKLKKTQVWTVDGNKAYVITFSAQESRYDDYLPSVESMLDSLQINSTQNSGNSRTSTTTATSTRMPDLGSSNATISSDTPISQGGIVPQDLVFSDDSAGIQMQYPDNWTRVQPGAPLDDRRFAILVSFISPPGDTKNATADNSPAPISRVSLGVHDLRTPGSNGTANVTLEQYNASQSYIMSGQGASISESEATTMAGLPAHRISYTHDNNDEIQTMQIWALKGDKVYHFIFTADKGNFAQILPASTRYVKIVALI